MTREEAIKILNSLFLVAEVLKVGKEKRREIKEALNMAIEALSEERTGEWVDRNDEDVWNYCSVCGEQSIDLFDYCPKCGAKMEVNNG